jgi:hypothetical protein
MVSVDQETRILAKKYNHDFGKGKTEKRTSAADGQQRESIVGRIGQRTE